MPKGTKVARCVDKVQKQGKAKGNAIAICTKATNQVYATGKKRKNAKSK